MPIPKYNYFGSKNLDWQDKYSNNYLQKKRTSSIKFEKYGYRCHSSNLTVEVAACRRSSHSSLSCTSTAYTNNSLPLPNYIYNDIPMP